ncbi:MAG: Lrp/AsnC family transcriptional regulator [Chromatiaceae bacterium]|nr:Lrp/AsnC family transcriptional regulator [Chromatiaceae bacterium]
MGRPAVTLSEAERRLLDEYQRGLPLDPRPFARVAERLGISERQVLDRLQRLQDIGVVSRVGPVFRPNRVGVSTLAALAVPPDSLAQVADVVSAFAEVNHNYEREHDYNLWFVVTARDAVQLEQVLETIAARTGLEPLNLPMLEDYYIDLGFRLQWT